MAQQVEPPLISCMRSISDKTTENYLIHTHAEYEVYYFLSGDVDYLIDGKQYIALKPHTLMLIPPEVFHGVRVNSTAAYERCTLHFHPNVLSVERRALLLRAFPQGGRAAMRNADQYCLMQMEETGVSALLSALRCCVTQPPERQKLLIPVLTEALLALVLLHAPKPDGDVPARQNDRVTRTQRELVDYVNTHFTEPISLDALAERFFVSKHYLNRIFRRAPGTTVMDYLLTKRVTYVQQLLTNGLPASHAATMAGFGDYTAFYRAYVKRFGHAPSQDRTRAPQRGDDAIHSYLRDAQSDGAVQTRTEPASEPIGERDTYWDALFSHTRVPRAARQETQDEKIEAADESPSQTTEPPHAPDANDENEEETT